MTKPNPITSRAWARRAEDSDDPSLDTMYLHLVRASETPSLGTPETPPAGVRIRRAEDWLDAPPDRMFADFIGDSQPRAADGGVLRTEERLAITAATAESGRLSNGTWTAVDAENTTGVLWIEGADGGAVPVAESGETNSHRALRDLPGKHGYGRARGTEHINRPDQTTRASALALRIDEIARGSGIDLKRDDETKVDPGELPSITAHRDGGVTMSLTTGWTGEPSTPDIVEEATAVAIGRAYQTPGRARSDERLPERRDPRHRAHEQLDLRRVRRARHHAPGPLGPARVQRLLGNGRGRREGPGRRAPARDEKAEARRGEPESGRWRGRVQGLADIHAAQEESRRRHAGPWPDRLSHSDTHEPTGTLKTDEERGTTLYFKEPTLCGGDMASTGRSEHGTRAEHRQLVNRRKT